MNLLAFDATTPVGTLGLRLTEGQVFTALLNDGRTHSQTLLPAIDALLDQAGLKMATIDGIVVANGPGSFTGLRIALATAKGLAHPKDLPLFAVSTLRGFSYHGVGEETLTLPMLDARRQQVYSALYHHHTEVLSEDTYNVVALAHEVKRICGDMGINQVKLVGDGAALHAGVFKEVLGADSVTSQGDLCDVRGLFWAFDQGFFNQHTYQTLPASYLRASQAERERASGINHAKIKGLQEASQ